MAYRTSVYAGQSLQAQNRNGNFTKPLFRNPQIRYRLLPQGTNTKVWLTTHIKAHTEHTGELVTPCRTGELDHHFHIPAKDPSYPIKGSFFWNRYPVYHPAIFHVNNVIQGPFGAVWWQRPSRSGMMVRSAGKNCHQLRTGLKDWKGPNTGRLGFSRNKKRTNIHPNTRWHTVKRADAAYTWMTPG